MVVFVDKTYVVASIMRVKRNFLNESFVTYKELEYVSSKLQNIFNKESISAIIVDKIDQGYYKIGDVISLNCDNGVCLDKIVDASFMALPCVVLNALYTDDYIYNLLINFRQEEIEELIKCKCTIDKIRKRS